MIKHFTCISIHHNIYFNEFVNLKNKQKTQKMVAVVCWVGSVNKDGLAAVRQILCGNHSLLLFIFWGVVLGSWVSARCGLLACAHEVYSEASFIVTFPCGPRIFTESLCLHCALWFISGFSMYFLHVAGCKNLHPSPVMLCRQDFFLLKLQTVLIFFCCGFHSSFWGSSVIVIVGSSC